MLLLAYGSRSTRSALRPLTASAGGKIRGGGGSSPTPQDAEAFEREAGTTESEIRCAAATRALTVSSPRAGGQPMTRKRSHFPA